MILFIGSVPCLSIGGAYLLSYTKECTLFIPGWGLPFIIYKGVYIVYLWVWQTSCYIHRSVHCLFLGGADWNEAYLMLYTWECTLFISVWGLQIVIYKGVPIVYSWVRPTGWGHTLFYIHGGYIVYTWVGLTPFYIVQTGNIFQIKINLFIKCI